MEIPHLEEEDCESDDDDDAPNNNGEIFHCETVMLSSPPVTTGHPIFTLHVGV